MPTRSEVIDVRQLVTVAEITTYARGLATEVALDPDQVGLDRPSVVNCDGVHTIEQSSLGGPIRILPRETLTEVCSAVAYAPGC